MMIAGILTGMHGSSAFPVGVAASTPRLQWRSPHVVCAPFGRTMGVLLILSFESMRGIYLPGFRSNDRQHGSCTILGYGRIADDTIRTLHLAILPAK